MAEEKQTATTFGMMKWVHFMFAGGLVVVGWVFLRAIESIWTTLNLRFVQVPAPNGAVAFALAALAALALAWWAWKNYRPLAVEVVSEVAKVVWPTRKELYQATVVVIIFSIVSAVILGLFDAFWSWLTGLVY